MRIIVSKILNRTDLAESESHGGLVITKGIQGTLKDIFEAPKVYRDFKDKNDGEVFKIQYADYTSNKKTPNDRITPIGKYKSKHELIPGDVLYFEKEISDDKKEYIIEYARKLNSVFFVGKSGTVAEALNFDQMEYILKQNLESKKISIKDNNEIEINVRYLGRDGLFRIIKKEDKFELYFNDEHIEENNKYYELDTTTDPFELRKTETWRAEIILDEDILAANEELENRMIREVSAEVVDPKDTSYSPIPEEKAAPVNTKGRSVPRRDNKKAKKALARASFLCEYNNEHKLFKRRNQNVNYTEPHHLIPLEFDSLFENSLDVEANIVSLCSYCHDLIHYGDGAEVLIRALWERRKDELIAAGLGTLKNGDKLDIDILLDFYGIY